MAFTFFFRDRQVLDQLVDLTLPVLAGRSHPRVWDAGAATGQEPYTLSILFAERMGPFAFKNLRIDATDVEETGQFARTVAEAEYPESDLARLPEEVVRDYFEPGLRSGHLRVVEPIRSRISFQSHDLLSLQEIGHGYSAIVCKNVLLHFQPPQRLDVLMMFHRALSPGGLLATEQTQEMPAALNGLFQRVSPGGSVFRKLEGCPCQA